MIVTTTNGDDFEKDARSFRPAAEILLDLRVGSVVLLTATAGKADDLRRHGIAGTGTRYLADRLADRSVID